MIIALDIDGVLADLVTPWLDEYSWESDHHLTPEDITDYDITKFVLPAFVNKLQVYIKDGRIYRKVKPHTGAVQFTWDLHDAGHRIVYVTKSPVASMGIKYDWLLDHGFWMNEVGYYEVLDKDKSLIRADILLDDCVANVITFKGTGVLMADKPWSRNQVNKVRYSVSSFSTFLDWIKG